MFIGIITFEIFLEACFSLKEKRHRLSNIKNFFGKIPNIAIAETDKQDSLKSGILTLITLANEKSVVDKMLTDIENKLNELSPDYKLLIKKEIL